MLRFLLACTVLLLGWSSGSHAQPAAEATIPDVEVPGSPERPVQIPSFAELAAERLPAVVNISTTQTVEGPAMPRRPQLPPGLQLPPGVEEFFEEFFGRGDPGGEENGEPWRQRRPTTALGSGFIIDPEGYVVTNNHVVANASEIRVILHDDTELPAEVVGRDPRTDLARLRVENGEQLPAVSWGNSDAARVGDWVLAIGNPFGLGGTVTAGIISARARDIQAGPYDDFIQTDAAINRGNSGGPLFNMTGEVIGVNTAIFSPTGGNIGIGFAVPSSLARAVVDELRRTGTVRRGWIGVAIQPVTEEISEALSLPEASGALVAQVDKDGPAARAGIRAGDVILSLAGEPVESPRGLARRVAATEIGRTVPVELWRDSERQTVEVEIGLLQDPGPVAASAAPQQGNGTESAVGRFGFAVAPLSEADRERLDVQRGAGGVMVTEVEPRSVAARQGLAPGDLITQVGQQPVSQPEQLAQALDQAQQSGHSSVLLLRQRDGQSSFITLPLG